MAKLLLLSVVFVMIVVPVTAARDPNARHGLKKVLVLMVGFNLLYLFLIRFVYPHLQ